MLPGKYRCSTSRASHRVAWRRQHTGEVVDEAASKLTGITEAKTYELAANSWRNRIRTATDFLRAFNRAPQSESELASAWNAVLERRLASSDAERSAPKPRRRCTRWSPILSNFAACASCRVLHQRHPTYECVGYRGRTHRPHRSVGVSHMPRGEANARIASIKRWSVRFNKPISVALEDAILSAATKLPLNYEHPYKARIGEAAEAVHLLGKIQRAVSLPFPSDRKIASAYDKLYAKNPKLAKRLDKANPSLYAEAESARARRKILDLFAAIDKEEPRATSKTRSGKNSGRSTRIKFTNAATARNFATGSRNHATASRPGISQRNRWPRATCSHS